MIPRVPYFLHEAIAEQISLAAGPRMMAPNGVLEATGPTSVDKGKAGRFCFFFNPQDPDPDLTSA